MKTKPTAKPVQVETVALPFGDRDIFAAVQLLTHRLKNSI